MAESARTCLECGQPLRGRGQPPGAVAEPWPRAPEGGDAGAQPGPATAAGGPPAAGASTPPAGGPPSALPPFPRPDVNLLRALRRSSAQTTLTAGIASGLLSAVLVTGGAVLVAILWWAAHLAGGCTAEAAAVAGGCRAGGANGYLTNLAAVLWQGHGAAEDIGLASGVDATVRIPLGTGILLCAAAVYLAGRLTVRILFLRSPRDAAVRSLVIAATHTVALMILGAALTARGGGLAVGPHYGLLLLWGVGVGFVGAYAGILRRTFPDVPPAVMVRRFAAAIGPAAPFASAALAGLAVAAALSTIAGVIAMAGHVGQTADVLRAAVGATTSKPWPDGGGGTVAAVVLLVLAAPTWAAWVLAYSLVIPTVSAGAHPDAGLTVGGHDAYLWFAVLIPIASTLLTGYAAARLRRAGTVESAVVSGAGAGFVWAVLAWVAVALLDGSVSVSGGLLPASAAGAGADFGPALGETLGALLLWGVVGGTVGGYVALATVSRESRLPVLRRYSPAVVGPPLVPDVVVCPTCALRLPLDAAFCSRCGTPMSREAATAAALRDARSRPGVPPMPDGPPPAEDAPPAAEAPPADAPPPPAVAPPPAPGPAPGAADPPPGSTPGGTPPE